MSFLSPLYALAAAAIALPILLHLIRKQPKGNQVFSSLMFLEPSPPRLTRRSRVDQWWLLLLRIAAVLLFAFAFTRPYRNLPESTESAGPAHRRILLIDTSASMRRDGLWQQALKQVNDLVQESSPEDVFALMTFDDTLKTLVSFDEYGSEGIATRKQLVPTALAKLQPSWRRGDLGLALVTAADMLHGSESEEEDGVQGGGEIVLFSDLENGNSIVRLENYQWPSSVRVRLKTIEAKAAGNAFAQILNRDESRDDAIDAKEGELGLAMRVRVSNSENATRDALALEWIDSQGNGIPNTSQKIQVPRGESLVFKIAAAPNNAVALKLDGDECDFDNKVFYAATKRSKLPLVCIDDAGKKPTESMGYFLQKVPFSDSEHEVEFQWRAPGAAEPLPTPKEAPFMVAGAGITDGDADALHGYIKEGGKVLWVLDEPLDDVKGGSAAARLAKLTQGPPATIREANGSSYAMLERIDFTHPLFSDFTDSKFNDFTKIRFWSHRVLEVNEAEGWQLVAGFDDKSPALLYQAIEKGGLWILTAGWQPEQSQLALSSKYVPWMTGLYRLSQPAQSLDRSMEVGDVVHWNDEEYWIDTEGTRVSGDRKDESTDWHATLDSPGIALRMRGTEPQSVAVNLHAAESDTATMDSERLERLGVSMSLSKQVIAHAEASKRQLRATELEAQQGWWRWMLMAVVGFISIESLWTSVVVKRQLA